MSSQVAAPLFLEFVYADNITALTSHPTFAANVPPPPPKRELIARVQDIFENHYISEEETLVVLESRLAKSTLPLTEVKSRIREQHASIDLARRNRDTFNSLAQTPLAGQAARGRLVRSPARAHRRYGDMVAIQARRRPR
jgi:hypothetical protein